MERISRGRCVTTRGHDGLRRTRCKTNCKTGKRRGRGRGGKSDCIDECNANHKRKNVTLAFSFTSLPPLLGLKSERRRRRLRVTPRGRRRDRRRVRERALLPCVDLTSRSCRDVELRAHKKRRSSDRSCSSRRAPSGSDALWRPHAPLLCVRVYTWCVCTHGRVRKPTTASTNQPINLRVQ